MSELYLFGDLSPLLFVAVAFATIAVLMLTIVHVARKRWRAARICFVGLVVTLTVYGLALLSISAAWPRRFVPAGERQCFDDWCVGAVSAATVATGVGPGIVTCGNPGSRLWEVHVRVSNRGRGRAQRARDAVVDVEDETGDRHRWCLDQAGEPLGGAGLRRLVAGGETIEVSLRYNLPLARRPVGVVVSHGAFPDFLIIGATQAAFHPRPLLRLTVEEPDEHAKEGTRL